MSTRKFSRVYPGLSQEEVWRVWTDINNWPSWHEDLEYCKLKGAFAVGNYFLLKPKDMKKHVKIDITEIEEGTSFTDCTTFFGAKMYDTHRLEETSEGVRLENTLSVTGPLRWVWCKLVARHVANSVPEEMEALVKLIRAQHG